MAISTRTFFHRVILRIIILSFCLCCNSRAKVVQFLQIDKKSRVVLCVISVYPYIFPQQRGLLVHAFLHEKTLEAPELS